LSSLHAKTIYIFEDDEWTGEPVYGELQVLEATSTTLHFAGSTSQFRTIKFWLLTRADYTTIEAAYKAGTTVVLLDWNADNSNVKIRDLKVIKSMTDTSPAGAATRVVLQCSAKLQKV